MHTSKDSNNNNNQDAMATSKLLTPKKLLQVLHSGPHLSTDRYVRSLLPCYVRTALRGVQAVQRGAVLQGLSRVIQLYDYYYIAIGAKQLSVLMLKEGPWEGCCLGVKEILLACLWWLDRNEIICNKLYTTRETRILWGEGEGVQAAASAAGRPASQEVHAQSCLMSTSPMLA
jgi:hypothetical protein